ncbi:hypothetical protein R1flu_011373 [Riccia fluitans]|uniref:Uncharacterized protein n=1 Tax=Riccia fluitans TaxID=41844 RepID=A0ABD1Z801_9MARC
MDDVKDFKDPGLIEQQFWITRTQMVNKGLSASFLFKAFQNIDSNVTSTGSYELFIPLVEWEIDKGDRKQKRSGIETPLIPISRVKGKQQGELVIKENALSKEKLARSNRLARDAKGLEFPSPYTGLSGNLFKLIQGLDDDKQRLVWKGLSSGFIILKKPQYLEVFKTLELATVYDFNGKQWLEEMVVHLPEKPSKVREDDEEMEDDDELMIKKPRKDDHAKEQLPSVILA